jgi:diguanylate cyclase (GGDEF)-like protein/PAS domain S-box-containing protein
LPVLVVDPSRASGQEASRLLRSQGYQVAWSASYAHALAGVADGREGWSYYALVVGLCGARPADVQSVLTRLAAPDLRAHPAVLVTDEASPRFDDWLARRAHATTIPGTQVADRLQTALESILPSSPCLTAPRRQPRPQPVRILLVDDAPTARASYQDLLNQSGYDVVTAGDCDEGFSIACRGGLDLAIVDFFMPTGTGDELCRRLAEDPRTAGLASVVLTASNRDPVIHRCLDAGAIDCVFKNESKDLFLARISSITRGLLARRTEETRRRQLESILACVGEGVFGVDREGRITFINRLARRLLGWEEEDTSLLGAQAHALLHYAQEDGSEIPVETSFLSNHYSAGRKLHSWETVFWHRSGRPIPVECTVYPFLDQEQRQGSIVAFTDISERRRLYERMWWMATHDALTSLPDRRFLEDQLGKELERLRQGDDRSALVCLDIDHFRYINESAGPSVGDRVLIEVARELERRLRDHDLLARLGDDAFALILRGLDETAACHAAESLRQSLQECSFDHEGQTHSIQASLGLVLMDRFSPPAGEILANAELACHMAKKQGRGKIHVHRAEVDSRQVAQSRFGWSSRLRKALQHNGFMLYYQPILRLPEIHLDELPREDGLLWRNLREEEHREELYEVLLRLDDGAGGVIRPGEFLPSAERFNLMLEIDLWVLSHALETLARLHGEERRVSFFINLSGQTLGAASLKPFITSKIRELGLDPKSLVFEITESDAIENLDGARSLIEDLQALGCHFALDDFGSGFSSFRHLRSLPVDIIKIDGLFVRGMVTEGADLAMVASLDEIAHSLGRQTVAEFVETPAALRLLKRCGVDYVQGNYISPPLPSLGVSQGSGFL